MNKKRFLKILFLFAMLLLSFGCGKIKSGKSLFEWAKSEYGDCTIVSMSETDDKTIVVLHDTLQDFDYEVISSMSKIVIDGSNFGSLPNTSDTFEKNLKEKVIFNAKDELDAICNKEGMRYEYADGGESIINIFAIILISLPPFSFRILRMARTSSALRTKEAAIKS